MMVTAHDRRRFSHSSELRNLILFHLFMLLCVCGGVCVYEFERVQGVWNNGDDVNIKPLSVM